MISFKVSKADGDTIKRIVDRAIEVAAKHGRTDIDRMSLHMDLTAAKLTSGFTASSRPSPKPKPSAMNLL